jgi:outer membrane protein assembly factor BamB
MRVLIATGPTLRGWSHDGAAAWERRLSSDIRMLATTDGALAYVGLAEKGLAAIDVVSGAPRWQIRLDGQPRALASIGNRVYFGTDDKRLCAYTAQGKKDWCFRRVDVAGAPAVDDKRVYVLTVDNTAVAFDRSGGDRRWRAELQARPARGPVLVGDTLIAALTSGVVAAIPRETGAMPPPPESSSSRDRLLAPSIANDGQVFGVVWLSDNSKKLVAFRPAKDKK